ncbi:zinc-containing alcohol dehydrogenase [Enterococcus sp. DIV0802]
MGIVEEVGSAVTKVKKGNRVVIPFNIGCGECHFCTHHMESQCDNSNPNPMFDQGGLFGFGKMKGMVLVSNLRQLFVETRIN